MLEYIADIDRVVMESQMNVCDSIIDLIDKYENVREYDEESTVGEIVMESMLVFMEASKSVKRTKDLKQWMESKGYLYKGDNPKKKKEANRMLHFLQQHDFDPKTSTYLTDIVDKNGNKIRVPLYFDGDGPVFELTSAEKKLKDEITGKGGNIDPFYMDLSNRTALSLYGKLTAKSLLTTGKNSFYSQDKKTDGIYLSSKITKGKQDLSQGLLKHEEGHAADYKTRRNETGINKKDIADIKNETKKESNKLKSSGMYANPHDEARRERYADAYAASHAKKRTKNGMAKFNKKDLERMFKGLGNIVNDAGAAVHFKDLKIWCEKCIEKCDYLINNDWDPEKYHAPNKIAFLSDEMETLLSKLKVFDEQKLCKDVLDILKENADEDIQNMFKNSLHKLELKKNELIKMGAAITSIDAQIQLLQEALEEDDSEYQQAAFDNLLEYTKTDLKKIFDAADKKPLRERTTYSLIPIITDADIKTMAKMESPSERAAWLKKTKTPIIKRWKKAYEKMLTNINEFEKECKGFNDVSSATRYAISKKYLKEYFEDFFGDDEYYTD